MATMVTFRRAVGHRQVRLIAFGWLGFVGENLVMSHNRDLIISNYGDGVYHGVYNTLSTVACGCIAYGFLKGRNRGPRIRFDGVGLGARCAGFVLMGTGLGLASQMFPRIRSPVVADTSSAESSSAPAKFRCPMDFRPVEAPADGVYGVVHITRHPMLWSMGLSGLGLAAVSTYATNAVMWSMPIVMTMIGGAHQDYRFRRGIGSVLTPEVDAKTSHIPFLALATGAASSTAFFEEMKWENLGCAFALAGIKVLRV
eukprot:CAMPEP_0204353296 /NCGR_PEP_ID=MMETSP0469-20131031/32557_1 /ASSEMBLY_ACC=CAM_ASM_000384 /TAXON_ID=2969 /ORGANISM="Oxyrrhis marina" /LENGTH=255 /DNA_ID=CAMNT_0051340183 /DNA_START=16 /DNA_END=783 /DNA_ORIENTATION=+